VHYLVVVGLHLISPLLAWEHYMWEYLLNYYDLLSFWVLLAFLINPFWFIQLNISNVP
jgi:hypothetical protein